MPILHMETDLVRNTGQQLQQVADSLNQQTQQLNQSVQNLAGAWQGPSSNVFTSEVQTLLNTLSQLGNTGETLNQRLQREVDEWENIDSNLSVYGVSNNNVAITQEYNPATSGLVTAILEDEADRRGFDDTLGDIEAWFIDKYEGRLESTERFLLEKTIGQPIEKISLGRAQMEPEAVMEMVEKGYLPKPENWEEDKLDITLRWLLDEDRAEELVSARINQIVDHWEAQGVDISHQPEIIGTLYSMGLEGEKGVHPNPQPNDRGQDIADRAGDLKSGQL